ncbi:hypothetical protein SXIM_36410 [Streptomyces xiamenensis]|uniref:Uncharacterized protein n=1 Tax=Streptomyces xiamenensis TaxID=408015 RepID=A0A0F7FY82_9ACTN|nr:hypothetical protein SXIM_36410 [Streptomyces xiamenensis]
MFVPTPAVLGAPRDPLLRLPLPALNLALRGGPIGRHARVQPRQAGLEPAHSRHPVSLFPQFSHRGPRPDVTLRARRKEGPLTKAEIPAPKPVRGSRERCSPGTDGRVSTSD